MRKTVLTLLLIVFGIIIFYFGILSFVVKSEFEHDGIPNDLSFNKEIWENGTIRQRGQMVNNLLDSIGIIKKDKATVLNILGKPNDSIIYDDGETKSRLIYDVDRGDIFNYQMIIFFDSLNHANYILFDD